MATKTGRAQLRDIRHGRTLWVATPTPVGLVAVPRYVHVGLTKIRVGEVHDEWGFAGHDIRQAYAWERPIHGYVSWRQINPLLDFNVVEHRGGTHLRNLFTTRRACERFIRRHQTHRLLTNAECSGFQTESDSAG